MTVSSLDNTFRYQGNGSTDTFAFTGRIFSTSDIVVQILTRATNVVAETLTLTTHYSVTINGPESASITVVAAKIPTALQDIFIYRDLGKTQSTDIPTGTKFPAVSIENAFDRTVSMVQDIAEIVDRAVVLERTSTDTPPTIGTLTAGKLLQIDATGETIEASSVSSADLSDYVDDAQAAAVSAAAASSSASGFASAASSSASAAAASAVTAAASAANLSGTSATSVLIGTGSKAFTTQTGKFFNVGNWVLVASDANEVNYMHGQVTAYSGANLTVDVTNTGGSGTFSDWVITVSGTRGAIGPTGPAGPAGSGAGDLLASNNLSDVASASTSRTNLGLGTIATQNSNGVTITGGTISGITDITVADGGTGASSITLNSVILGNGTSALSGNLVAPGTSGNVLTSNGTTWQSTAPASSTIPVGVILPYGGSTEPSGWIFAYGQAISRTTYSALFAVYSTTYGVGDGSTTFNVPDLRGRVPAGQDDMGGTSANRLTDQSGGLDGDVLGDTGGSETHTLIENEIPSITITGQTRTNFQQGGSTVGVTTTSPTSSMTVDTIGGGAAHNNVQPTIILNYIIKT